MNSTWRVIKEDDGYYIEEEWLRFGPFSFGELSEAIVAMYGVSTVSSHCLNVQ